MKEVRSGDIRTVYVGPCHTIRSYHNAARDMLNLTHPGGQNPAHTDDSSFIKKKPL